MAPGWHAYWRSPGDAGFPPSIDWGGSENLKSAQLFWPAPKRFILDGLITQGYENSVVLPIAVTLERATQPARLQASVRYAACKDICVPYTAKFTLPLPSGVALPGPEASMIANAWTTVPGTPAEAGLGVSSVVISRVDTPSPGSVLSVIIDMGSKPLLYPDVFIEGLLGSARLRTGCSDDYAQSDKSPCHFKCVSKKPCRCIDRRQKFAVYIRGWDAARDICGRTCRWSAACTIK
ncbi:MAG: hypothetical protein B7X09_03840 [Acidiphilium sp. 21-66-27]|nr:MAG: hypothetical protein B7X09_03840 [Acidiphilium sp. 21-66-27]